MKKHEIYIKEWKDNLISLELIETIDSERYGDYIEFKNRVNMYYVNEYRVIEGAEKEKYINSLVDSTTATYKSNLNDLTDNLNKELKLASNYIDIQPYINKIKG